MCLHMPAHTRNHAHAITHTQLRTHAVTHTRTRMHLPGALAGESRLGVIICLSQSKQNGWETWFSIANYGRTLSELKTLQSREP